MKMYLFHQPRADRATVCSLVNQHPSIATGLPNEDVELDVQRDTHQPYQSRTEVAERLYPHLLCTLFPSTLGHRGPQQQGIGAFVDRAVDKRLPFVCRESHPIAETAGVDECVFANGLLRWLCTTSATRDLDLDLRVDVEALHSSVVFELNHPFVEGFGCSVDRDG